MQKMINSVQNYAWGSRDALTRLYGIPNNQGLPMAELWMGAHPQNSSQLINDQKERQALCDLIQQNPAAYLGPQAQKGDQLPFLFKVLCAAQPLSLQVHPDKQAAQKGFAKENARRIPITAKERLYKDDNHKPELLYALTPFKAMNGFRTIEDLQRLFTPLVEAHPDIHLFVEKPSLKHLSNVFLSLLSMTDETKKRALAVLQSVVAGRSDEPWSTIQHIASFYPEDPGLFAPVFLNVITLKPGEAMFLEAQTPHAYIEGVALEVMANSDNVLRAGLTEKWIDVPELMANVRFVPKPASNLLTLPLQRENRQIFPVPVSDFAFSVYQLKSDGQLLTPNIISIIFCMEGNARLDQKGKKLELIPGESCFCSAGESSIRVYGKGKIAYVSHPPINI
ncbi:mannose-6-phosphate isomerase [Candidatus Williamhamiltonella defendens]|nr:mannose-6-phosphate isomerase [Candidatus Hamiltonella defensa]AYB49249.1 mannose-6-phosphate isomerase [Candidatus Hamiltonella defensa]